jgi:tetratricopeptide (TPR) repeat protein
MSLINRMLRDLSSRQPGTGNVMDGIQLPQESRPRASVLARLGMLAVLVVGFTGLLWLVFGPKPVKIPQPRGLPAGATVAADPAAAGDPSAGPRLQMETQLGQAPPAPPPPPEAAPAAGPAPAAVQPAAPAPEAAAVPAPARAVRAKAPVATKTPAQPRALSGEELYARARRALERGDEVAAEAALVEALAAKPDLHYAREDLGNLRIRQGRLNDAEAALRAGLEIDASWVGYRRLAARVELARDRPAAAVEVLLRDPPPVERDVDYHALLASGYQRLGRHEEAARGYRELARVQPDEASWFAGYGLSRDALDDAAGALAAYARARQLGGLDPRVLEHINLRTAALQAGGE